MVGQDVVMWVRWYSMVRCLMIMHRLDKVVWFVLFVM